MKCDQIVAKLTKGFYIHALRGRGLREREKVKTFSHGVPLHSHCGPSLPTSLIYISSSLLLACFQPVQLVPANHNDYL